MIVPSYELPSCLHPPLTLREGPLVHNLMCIKLALFPKSKVYNVIQGDIPVPLANAPCDMGKLVQLCNGRVLSSCDNKLRWCQLGQMLK
jgi:hypothetical protein